MSVRYRLIPLALLAGASAAALSCGDASPTSVALQTPAVLARSTQPTAPSKSTGLVTCSQSYDSVTQVIGPLGGLIAVGHHFLWVDSLALSIPVAITAVAPADTVRWVRFHPDGLVFRTNSKTGYPAIIYTDYTGCGVPTTSVLRIAQVTDSLGILGYLQTYVKFNKNPWSQGTQYVAAVLLHFSNYAVAW
jgi:hypothetical protein